MTYEELLPFFSTVILGEEDSNLVDQWGNEQARLEYLYNAATMIASELSLYRNFANVAVLKDAIIITSPIRCAKVIGKIQVGSYDLSPVDMNVVMRKRVLGQFDAYNFEPRRTGSSIFLSAPCPEDNSATFEYVEAENRASLSETSPIWNGLHEDFHYLVAYRAGRIAYFGAELYGSASIMTREYNEMVRSLALRLGITANDIQQVLLPVLGGSQEVAQ